MILADMIYVSHQLIAERDRLNKDLENAHSSIKDLEVSLGERTHLSNIS